MKRDIVEIIDKMIQELDGTDFLTDDRKKRMLKIAQDDVFVAPESIVSFEKLAMNIVGDLGDYYNLDPKTEYEKALSIFIDKPVEEVKKIRENWLKFNVV